MRAGAFLRRSKALPPSPHIGAIGDIRFEFCVGPGDSPQYELMLRGAYEPGVGLAIRRHLSPGDVFVDVGANIGYLTAIALSRVGATGAVHAFEPAPPALMRLQRVKDLNPDAPLTIYPISLGVENGEAMLSIAEENAMGWSSFVPDAVMAEKVHDELVVPMRRFDDWVREQGLERIDLIKIDVEGFEFPVLEGMRESLERWHPPLICEITPDAATRRGGSSEDIAGFFDALGYRATDPEAGGMRVDLHAISKQITVLLQASGR